MPLHSAYDSNLTIPAGPAVLKGLAWLFHRVTRAVRSGA
jgi:hypothetical protein